MQIKTALVLCAGFGKRVLPITTDIPKPLIKYNNVALLENTINFLIDLKIKSVKINTFYLKEKIKDFINKKSFPIDIEIIDDGETILGTGGGIFNLMNSSNDNDFLTINPDTIWDSKYINPIFEMEKFYFDKKIKNSLLVVNHSFSFDKRFNGDFEFKDNTLTKEKINNFMYTGCQIISKELFMNRNLNYFPISEIWDNLMKESKLYGFEYKGNFLHLTDIEIYDKLFNSKN